MIFNDNAQAVFGTGSDFKIYHDGTNSYIDNVTGAIRIRTNNTENAIYCYANAQVELYHDNSKKIETTAAGVTVTGTVTDSKGELRNVILNAQGSDYTLVAADAGKFIRRTGGNVTIPDDIFATGNMVTILNDASSSMTITAGAGFSLYNTADATTGSRTLAGRGMATILFNSTEQGYVSGSGIS